MKKYSASWSIVPAVLANANHVSPIEGSETEFLLELMLQVMQLTS